VDPDGSYDGKPHGIHSGMSYGMMKAENLRTFSTLLPDSPGKCYHLVQWSERSNFFQEL
jgi:hypothetical protein